MARILLRFLASTQLALSALAFWWWYDTYLRIDFNELGRYFDETSATVYTDENFIWGLFALGLALGGLLTWHLSRPRQPASVQG